MAEQYPITLSEFREWLETKRPTAFVGKRRWPDGCPLQACAADLLDKSVYATRFALFVDDALFFHPGWANAFVYHVDESGVLGSRVTARTALRLLDRVSEVAS